MSDLSFMKYSTGTLIVSRFLKSRFPLEESLFTVPFPDFIASLLHAPPLVHLLLWTSETRFGFYNVYKELSFELINKKRVHQRQTATPTKRGKFTQWTTAGNVQANSVEGLSYSRSIRQSSRLHLSRKLYKHSVTSILKPYGIKLFTVPVSNEKLKIIYRIGHKIRMFEQIYNDSTTFKKSYLILIINPLVLFSKANITNFNIWTIYRYCMK